MASAWHFWQLSEVMARHDCIHCVQFCQTPIFIFWWYPIPPNDGISNEMAAIRSRHFHKPVQIQMSFI